MKRKAFLVGLLILAVIVLVGAVVGVPRVLGSTGSLTSLSADEILAYRWQAMAEYYSKLGARDLTTLSADEVLAYRWQAVAEYYSKFGDRETSLSAASFQASRWYPLTSFYSQLGTRDLTTLSADDASTYRWLAMAEAYSISGRLLWRTSAPGR